MNDHNLDDLIIEKIEPNKNKKAKSFLTILALAIVVMVVAIIFTKVMLNDSKEEQLLLEQVKTETVSPELTLQSIDEPKEEIAKPGIKTDMTPKEALAEPVLEKPKTEISLSESNITLDEPDTKEEGPKEPIQTQTTPAKVLPVKEEPKKTAPKEPVQTQTKPAKKEPAAKVKKEIVKTEAAQPQQTTQQQSSRPANVITRPDQIKKTESGTYYIQVGSFTSSPNQHILNTIKKNNFHYTIVKKSNGAKKLLIGPYKDRISAEKALVNVRDRINKRAFIKKN